MGHEQHSTMCNAKGICNCLVLSHLHSTPSRETQSPTILEARSEEKAWLPTNKKAEEIQVHECTWPQGRIVMVGWPLHFLLEQQNFSVIWTALSVLLFFGLGSWICWSFSMELDSWSCWSWFAGSIELDNGAGFWNWIMANGAGFWNWPLELDSGTAGSMELDSGTAGSMVQKAERLCLHFRTCSILAFSTLMFSSICKSTLHSSKTAAMSLCIATCMAVIKNDVGTNGWACCFAYWRSCTWSLYGFLNHHVHTHHQHALKVQA